MGDSRIHYLDNIRSVVIVAVVFFHAILPYVLNCPWWYVNDPPPIPYSFYYIVFLEPLLMPILFFIAGLLAWPSYERKGAYLFLASKVKRLIFPFLLCTFLFSPIMPFIRQSLRAAGGGLDSPGFWPFWLGFLESGSKIHSGSASISSDIVVNQYWFLMLLFIFFAGFSLWAGRRSGAVSSRSNPEPVERAPRGGLIGSIFLFGLGLGLIYSLVCLFIEGNVWVTLGSLWQIQPAKVPVYLGFFLAGVSIERKNLMPGILAFGRPGMWFISAALITVGYLTTVVETAGIPDASLTLVIASRFLRIFFIISVSLWLLTFFHRRVNMSTLFWKELSENSYNIYLIHMVPQVVIQLLFLSWPAASPVKFVSVSLLTLVVSYLFSRFLVKKSSTATVLFLFLIFILMGLIFR
jgi:glucan biosynthesis protein C